MVRFFFNMFLYCFIVSLKNIATNFYWGRTDHKDCVLHRNLWLETSWKKDIKYSRKEGIEDWKVSHDVKTTWWVSLFISQVKKKKPGKRKKIICSCQISRQHERFGWRNSDQTTFSKQNSFLKKIVSSIKSVQVTRDRVSCILPFNDSN